MASQVPNCRMNHKFVCNSSTGGAERVFGQLRRINPGKCNVCAFGRFGLRRLIADQLDFVIGYLMMEPHKRLRFQLDRQAKRLTNVGFQNHGGIGLVGVDAV